MGALLELIGNLVTGILNLLEWAALIPQKKEEEEEGSKKNKQRNFNKCWATTSWAIYC